MNPHAGMSWYLEDRRRHRDPRLRRLADLRDGLRDQVVCLTVIGRQGELLALREAVRRRLAQAVRTYCFGCGSFATTSKGGRAL